MFFNRYVGVCLILSAFLSGCSNEFSGNRYDSATAGEVSRTEHGTVLSLRKVEIKTDGIGAGALLGGVSGGLIGSAFGGGNAKILTGTAGAIAGGVAGNAIQNRAQDGIEYTIKLDSGSVITLAQGTEPAISVGQKVYVVHSAKGRSRVVPE